MSETNRLLRARRLARATGVGALVVGLLVWVGWVAHVGFLTRAMPLVALSSLVGLGVLGWGSGVLLERAERERLAARRGSGLGDSQELLQAIVDNSEAVIFVKDLAGRYLLVNRRYECVFGRSRATVLGRTDHELYPREMADLFRGMDLEVAKFERALAEEEAVTQADGTHVYITVKSPLRDSEGKTYGIFGIATDITERKRVEEGLRTQLVRLRLLDQTTRAIGERQDLRSIFQVVFRSLEEHMPIDFGCAFLFDAAAGLLSVTSFGIRSEELAREMGLEEHVKIGVDENGLGRASRGQLVYEPDLEKVPFPFPVRLARGGLRSVVFAPLVVEGKTFGIVVCARCRTGGFSSSDCEFLRQLSGHVALAAHQAQLYSALQGAYEDLRQTQELIWQQERLRALGQLASGIAHDINNALSPASLYLQRLLEREHSLSERARQYLEIAHRAIEDVSHTVSRIGEFGRPREPQLALVPLDLNVILQQVINLTHARWNDIPQERGIVIRVQRDLETNLPAVAGAESDIRDALTNLVLNAIDAMPEGGTLTLRSHAYPNGQARSPGVASVGQCTGVAVEVCDTGIGMTAAVRMRCLEPFFTTKGERGTGLGLAMVYGMVQRHGGEIEIDSEPGKGTAVRLSFPVAAVAPSAELTADVPLESLRILIVDDDPLLLCSLQDTLEGEGHLIQVADGGQAGIDAFSIAERKAQPFDVVITDLGMPHIDGRAVAAAIKAVAPVTPVIMLTGWGYRLLAEKDLPPFVDRVLSKPPRLAELRAALGELTDGSPAATFSTGPRGG
jgi:PAS domain S-box-containing protein